MTRFTNRGLHWTIRTAAMLLMVGVSALSAKGRGDTSPMRCDIWCENGLGECDSLYHACTADGSDNAKNGHDDCRQGAWTTAGNGHHNCVPDPELAQTQPEVIQLVTGALDESNADQLTDLLAKGPATIHVNQGRGAIQVLDCRGDVVAHLPAPAALLSALHPATR